MAPYGHELIIDLYDCEVDEMTRKGVKVYCERVCSIIDMVREDFHIWASDPKNYETDPPHLHGVSAVQFITTSSLVIHTLPKMRRVYINLFSCKPFDASDALKFTAEYFSGTVANSTFLERQ